MVQVWPGPPVLSLALKDSTLVAFMVLGLSLFHASLTLAEKNSFILLPLDCYPPQAPWLKRQRQALTLNATVAYVLNLSNEIQDTQSKIECWLVSPFIDHIPAS